MRGALFVCLPCAAASLPFVYGALCGRLFLLRAACAVCRRAASAGGFPAREASSFSPRRGPPRGAEEEGEDRTRQLAELRREARLCDRVINRVPRTRPGREQLRLQTQREQEQAQARRARYRGRAR